MIDGIAGSIEWVGLLAIPLMIVALVWLLRRDKVRKRQAKQALRDLRARQAESDGDA